MHQKGSTSVSIEVPMPVARPSDDGKYQVRCAAGHVSTVIVDNVKFELLFEMGLNALVDGYPREAVSSFASALERFYEFYWHVVSNVYSMPLDQIDSAWKMVGKQSERQLGMFITAALLLTKQCPPLLNPNRDVKFRNEVIHGGYIPTVEEATAFGDVVMGHINELLATLRRLAPEAVLATYERLSPAKKKEENTSKSEIIWNDDDDHTGTINIISAVDVRHPVTADDDLRRGGVADQFKRILRDREPHRLITAKDENDLKAYMTGRAAREQR
jgi:hypothetical protein